MNWKEMNARYVRESELLIDSALIGDWCGLSLAK